jgi:anti-sigma-K factor RskA
MTMRYQSEELRQQLAAEYALGTLRGRARVRFEKLLRGDAGLASEVTFWHERLSEFATRLKPVAPREVVWTALERTINSAASTSRTVTPLRPVAAPAGSFSQRFWRNWALAASLAAVALSAGLVRQWEKHGELIAALDAAQRKPMPYVAVFQASGGDAQWAITLHPDQKMMRVVLSGSSMPADVTVRSLELWMLDSKGQPHSLGLLPVTGKHSHDMPLPGMPADEMGTTLTLAVSEEPRGGSPTGLPTGKVLGAVPAVRPI